MGDITGAAGTSGAVNKAALQQLVQENVKQNQEAQKQLQSRDNLFENTETPAQKRAQPSQQALLRESAPAAVAAERLQQALVHKVREEVKIQPNPPENTLDKPQKRETADDVLGQIGQAIGDNVDVKA